MPVQHSIVIQVKISKRWSVPQNIGPSMFGAVSHDKVSSRDKVVVSGKHILFLQSFLHLHERMNLAESSKEISRERYQQDIILHSTIGYALFIIPVDLHVAPSGHVIVFVHVPSIFCIGARVVNGTFQFGPCHLNHNNFRWKGQFFSQLGVTHLVTHINRTPLDGGSINDCHINFKLFLDGLTEKSSYCSLLKPRAFRAE
mmetsp:Transcript_3334/g.5458  ORF Transcript_3334/g.5458 Transcript_3334/m.5458 type:complete len:200 (-) Transcript_3334:594-1193(-)